MPNSKILEVMSKLPPLPLELPPLDWDTPKQVVFRIMRIIYPIIIQIPGLPGLWWHLYDCYTLREWIRRYDD